ncbi:MAG: galactose oxidase, partial [Bacteroidota bacterium]|nr:galactose oxidase [Bacteroidota bacterium]
MSIQKIRFIPIVLLMLIGFAACQDDTPVNPVKWTQLTDLSKFGGKARASATCFVIGKKAYVCCGRSGWRDGFLKEVWEYDSETDTWTRKRDFPGPARVKAVAGVIGTKAYMGMGAVGAYEPKNLFKDFWEYDSQTDTWTQKAAFPDSASNDLFAAVVDGAFYTVAGFDGIT